MRHAAAARQRPAFPGGQDVLTAATENAAISVTRFTPEIPGNDALVAKMEAEKAFVVLVQLRAHPPHEFKLDGRFERPPAMPQGALNVIDLNVGDACARLTAPADTLMFHLPNRALHDLAEAADARPVERLRAPDGWLTADPLASRMAPVLVHELAEPEGERNRLFIDHMLLGLGAHFARRYGGIAPQRRQRGGLAPWQERRARELLEARLADPPSIREVARECGLSADYFTRAFRASTGLTPHAWLQAQRIDRARRLMRDETASLAEVALACGFADQSHLSRVFLQHTGHTPGQWRRSHL